MKFYTREIFLAKKKIFRAKFFFGKKNIQSIFFRKKNFNRNFFDKFSKKNFAL